jgi:hypothetical protein
MSVRTDLIEDLIEEGKIDYVSLSDVLSEAEQQGAQISGSDEFERAMFLLEQMLEYGFVAVDLGPEDGGCTPWKDQDHQAILARVRRAWNTHPHQSVVALTHWFWLPEHLHRDPAAG